MRVAGLFVLGIVSLSARTALGSPRECDAWYAYTDDGKRYGYVHHEVVRLPDGNYRIRRESRIQVDVLGLNRETIEESARYVVTPDYRPVSIDAEGRQASGASRVVGRERGGAFEVTSTRVGLERSRTFDRPDEVLLAPCLEDWLADRPAGFRSGDVTLLDETTCRPRPARVRRLEGSAPGSAWSVDLGPDVGTERITLGDDGLLRSREPEELGAELRRCTAAEAKDIGVRTLDGRDLLMFPLDRPISAPQRLESLVVELSWKDVAFDRFRLEDDRQRVVERGERDGRRRAVVRLEAPAPMASPARLPVEGPEFAPYLAESAFIRPRDAQVVAVAREVVRGKADALEAARALCEWVSTHVETALIAELLSGPEVLACRKGKCSEYATLFASMARAVGIPTRIALGERMAWGGWGGHMWNEIYVGRWIPVDASANEVGRSFALLKLVDHETVEGTQPLRRALPASLEIKVVDFRLAPSALADTVKTGLVGHVYTNADLGCRLTVPEKTWSIEELSQPGAAVLRIKVPGRDDVRLHFAAFPLPGGVAPKAVIGGHALLYRTSHKEFEMVSNEPRPVKGLVGQQLVYRYTSKSGKPRRATEILWRKPSGGFLLSLDAPEPSFEGLQPALATLLKGFEDLERQ